MRDVIKETLKAIKGSSFEAEEDLLTAHYISSFELLNLISELEKSFNIKIELDKVTPEDFDSIDEIEALITTVMHG